MHTYTQVFGTHPFGMTENTKGKNTIKYYAKLYPILRKIRELPKF